MHYSQTPLSKRCFLFNLFIFMKPEVLKIGLPTNSRLSEDLKPFTDALGLEGKNGRMRAKGLEGAEFRLLRVQDIASFLRRGLLNIGLTGLDVMIEESLPLRDSGDSSREGEIQNIFSIKAGEPTRMTLLMRAEEKKEFDDWSQFKKKNRRKRFLQREKFGKNSMNIVTSYPRIVNASVLPGLNDYFNPAVKYSGPLRGLIRPLSSLIQVLVQEVGGKAEEIVRNGDFPGKSVALDIVKSGKTAKECNLVPFGEPILESTPGIFTFEGKGLSSRAQIQDCIQFIREKMLEAQLPTTDGLGRNFVDEGLKDWEYKSI